MIILDEEQGSSKERPLSGPTLRLPDPVAGRSASPLPDYETSQAQQTSHAPQPSLTSLSLRKPSFPNRFDSRFWRITFFALAIYVFLSVVIGIPIIVTRISFRKNQQPPPPINFQNLIPEDPDAAAPLSNPSATGMLMAASSGCNQWDSRYTVDERFVATAHHTLPPGGLFSVRSNATDEVIPRPGGMHNLTVGINNNASEHNVVFIVSLTTSSPELREQAHMCFSSMGKSRGLSVYMPQALAPSDVLAFDIQLLFPKIANITIAADLVTYLPMFHQSIGPFSQGERFGTINIAGAGVDITCDHLEANQIAVKSSYASISGFFTVTQTLSLSNIGGPITTNVTLHNDPTSGLATYLMMDTGNSDLLADVTMVSSVLHQPPKFNINGQTFNGSLSLNVGHDAATLPAVLNMQVNNNQAQSQVAVDSKFSGLIDLHTKLASVYLDYSQVITKDPTGAKRAWSLQIDSNSTSSTRGWIGWGTRPLFSPGTISVGSSLSSVSLKIGP